MTDAARGESRPRFQINRRALVVATVTWVVLVVAALGVAALMDDPPADAASPVPEGLPPIQLYLNRPLPASVANKGTLQAQLTEVRRLAETGRTAQAWVDYGVFSHRLQALQDAALAYRRALSVGSGSVEAQVGLIMLDAASDQASLERAEAALADLQVANPRNQVVAFNHAMLGVYLRDPAIFEPAFRTAADIDPKSPLGGQAQELLAAAKGTAAP